MLNKHLAHFMKNKISMTKMSIFISFNRIFPDLQAFQAWNEQVQISKTFQIYNPAVHYVNVITSEVDHQTSIGRSYRRIRSHFLGHPVIWVFPTARKNKHNQDLKLLHRSTVLETLLRQNDFTSFISQITTVSLSC
jgi:hypothetical protein